MPFTPEGISRAMFESAKKMKRGEEGILHPIELKDKEYFAKVWRGKHFEGGQYESLAYDEEEARTPVSPFWFKVKYYEGLLLQEAFPEQTVRIEAGFDPRIQKGEDGQWYFLYDQGRPVTVAASVRNGSEVQKKRDAIIEATYDEYLKEFEPDANGILRSTNPYRAAMKLGLADWEMQEAFGRDLSTQGFEVDTPRESLKQLEEKVRKQRPQSILIDFYRSGILPTHPEFNFIPTAESTERGPQGVFIEAAIVDLDLFRQSLFERHLAQEDRDRIEKKIGRYVLYRMLDEIYDELFFIQHHTSDRKGLREDRDVVSAVWKTLEMAREQISVGGVTESKEYLRKLKSRLYWTLEDYQEKGAFLEKIQELQQEIKK